jgi:hypothetical protein
MGRRLQAQVAPATGYCLMRATAMRAELKALGVCQLPARGPSSACRSATARPRPGSASWTEYLDFLVTQRSARHCGHLHYPRRGTWIFCWQRRRPLPRVGRCQVPTGSAGQINPGDSVSDAVNSPTPVISGYEFRLVEPSVAKHCRAVKPDRIVRPARVERVPGQSWIASLPKITAMEFNTARNGVRDLCTRRRTLARRPPAFAGCLAPRQKSA